MAVSFVGLNSSFDSGALISQLIDLEVQSRIAPLQNKISRLNDENSFLSSASSSVTNIKNIIDHKAISQGTTELASKSVTTLDNTNAAGTENYYTTITATDDAVAQTFDLEIRQLATTTTRRSDARIDNGVTGASTLATANLKGVTSITTGDVTIDGETIASVLTDSSTINDLLIFLQSFAAVSTATMDAEGRIAITGTAASIGSPGDDSNIISAIGLDNAVLSGGAATGIQKLTAAKASSVLNTLLTPITGTILTINGADVTYDPTTDSITTLINAINSESDTSVTAAYDDINGEVILTNKDTGALSMTISSNGDAHTIFRIDSAISETLGDNAEFSISTLNSGATLVSNSNTVTGLLNGVTLELKNLTPTGPSSPVNVTIAEDVSSVSSKLNSIINNVNSLLSGLDDRNDSFSRALSRKIKNTISTVHSGATNSYTSLIDIGLRSQFDGNNQFTGYSFDSTIFESKFLADRSDFISVLYGTDTATDPDSEIATLSDGSEGIITLLQRALDVYVDPDIPTNGIISQVRESITTQIDTANDRIERAQISIDAIEARLSRQFSQLDVINAQFQQQQRAVANLGNTGG